MSSLTVQFSTLQEVPASAPATNPAASNATQSPPQPNPTIEDTVTLNNQTLQNTATAQQPTQVQNAASTAPTPQTQFQNGTLTALNQSSAQGVGFQSQPSGANQASTTATTASSSDSTAAASSASQEQLAELEAMLQQLGVDPASLSGPALTALLPDAADPAALLAYAKQLEGTTPPAPAPITHLNVTM